MRPIQVTRIALLVAAGFLATSFAAIAAPNATINHYARVYSSPSLSADVINDVDEDDEVQVNDCTLKWCFLVIPGPNGWVRKKYIDFDEVAPPAPPPPDLPYGPDTCKPGYVWRDAIPGDHVCVTGASRDLAANENAIAGSRVDPLGAYGPNSCISGFGYVWREAYVGDVVCVSGARRTAVHQENLDGPSHRVLP